VALRWRSRGLRSELAERCAAEEMALTGQSMLGHSRPQTGLF